MEIPFIDAPEGACTNTVTHQARLVNSETWVAQRPYMLMIHAEQWTIIKKDWMKGCRLIKRDGGKCNIALKSIDSAIMTLNSLVETVIGR